MLSKTLRFDDDVLEAIRGIGWSPDGRHGVIKAKLDRVLYVKVNKALEAMGGKWNRKLQAHEFATDPRPNVEGLLTSGTLEVARDGFFETPDAVIDAMFNLVRPNGFVLEPSAGMGAIARRLTLERLVASVTCIEQNESRCQALSKAGFDVHCGDFLHMSGPAVYNTIFMNPPFEVGQDIKHVRHAFDNFLMPGGYMVSVMSKGVTFRGDALATEFRGWMQENSAWLVELPEGSFAASGTGVRAMLVKLRKPL